MDIGSSTMRKQHSRLLTRMGSLECGGVHRLIPNPSLMLTFSCLTMLLIIETEVFRNSGKTRRAGKMSQSRIRDLNDRGRGRTVETQGGGIMVLRALWELVE